MTVFAAGSTENLYKIIYTVQAEEGCGGAG